MLESAIEADFNRRVRKAGGISIKGAPVVAGHPDRIVLMPGGKHYLVELKTTTGVVSKVQALWHRRCAAIGHPVVVLRGSAEVRAWIESISGNR
jgi:hypothetical protein